MILNFNRELSVPPCLRGGFCLQISPQSLPPANTDRVYARRLQRPGARSLLPADARSKAVPEDHRAASQSAAHASLKSSFLIKGLSAEGIVHSSRWLQPTREFRGRQSPRS